MGFEQEENVTNPVANLGQRAGRSRLIASIDDSGTERLAVDAKVSNATLEANLDETNDEVAVYGGVDGSETANAATRQIINVDSAGRVRTDSTLQVADADVSTSNPVPVQGNAAEGAAVAGNPVRIGGSDGTNTRTIATDTSGRPVIVGGAASGAVGTGNPVPVAGAQDGTTTVRSMTVDPAGNTRVAGNVAHDAADSRDPVKIGGRARSTAITAVASDDRTDAIFSTTGGQMVAGAAAGVPTNLEVDSSGRPIVVGPAADGAAVAGNPVRIGGKDGSGNTQDIITDTTGNLSIVGNVARDDVDSGNPVKVGGRAVAHSAAPTEVAAADRTDFITNRHGVQWTIGGHPQLQGFEYNTTAAQTNDNILAAISPGTKHVLTRLSVTLDEATTVGVGFRIGWGTANVPAEGASGADAVLDMVLSHPGMVPGGGITIGDGSGVIGIGGDGMELRITCDVPTSGKLTVTGNYYAVAS